MVEEVILVDEGDNETGSAEKILAHRKGNLHRAFSVFVFNSQGDLLLQKRAVGKYHSAGLWANTCCGHPRPGEETISASKRRLFEEMGLSCELDEIFSFKYRTQFENGLTEHEYDHVYVGFSDEKPTVNPDEADEWKWVKVDWLQKDMDKHPERYAYWMKECFDRVVSALENRI